MSHDAAKSIGAVGSAGGASHAAHVSAPPPPTTQHASQLDKSQATTPIPEQKDGVKLTDEATGAAGAQAAAQAAQQPGQVNGAQAVTDPKAIEGVDKPKDANADVDGLKQQLEDMKKELEELKKNQAAQKPDEAQQSEGGGGGGGDQGGGTPQAGQAQQAAPVNQGQQANDPNSILQQDMAAVQAASQMGNQGQGMQMGAAQGLGQGQSVQGMGGIGGGMGAMNKQGALGKLATDYTNFKQNGAQIRPEVEQQVQQTLAMAGGVQGMQGMNPAMMVPGMGGAMGMDQMGRM